MLETRFTRLVGCRVPIQQAGMAALANTTLAAAVSKAGALGMVSVGSLSPEQIRHELGLVKEQTSNPFGANFLIPIIDSDDVSPSLENKELSESLEEAAKHVRLVDFFYCDPDPSLVKIVHSQGALASWQIGSREEAKAAVDAGCDIIVAQGIESGGHIRGRIGLMALLDQVLPITDLPVLAAGGISSGRAMAAALAAGASGVRVGTRFAASEEAGPHPVYAKAMIKAEAEDTVFTEEFGTGWPNAPHRVIRASLDAAKSFEGDIVGERRLRYSNEWSPVRKFQPIAVTKEFRGTIEAMPHWAGEGVGSVKSILPAAKIVDQMATEAERLLKSWA